MLAGMRSWLGKTAPCMGIIAIAALAACAGDGAGEGASASRARPGMAAMSGPQENVVFWQPIPLRSRVYPATRFTVEEGRPVLEARIELFDEMGDSVKGAGVWHFELVAGDHRREGAVPQRLYSWDVPMLTLGEQQVYYDRITRAYLFRLRLDSMAPARQTTTLHATLVLPSGERLTARHVLTPE